jgi:hypothetical protein
MSFRLTGLMAVLLLLAGGYYYLSEVRGAAEREEARVAAGRMLPLVLGDVSRLALRFDDSAVVVARSTEGWQILEPVCTRADSEEIEFILRDLRQLANAQVVAEGAQIREGRARLSDFGLDRPDDYIAITRTDGSADTLFWGDQSPTGSYRYVRRSGTMSVMTARSWDRHPFVRSLLGLRDRQIARIVPDSVRRIEVRQNGDRVVVALDHGVWQQLRPVEDLGDAEAIERFAKRLSVAQASDVAAEELADPLRFGLAEPRLTVIVDQGPSLGLEQVQIGKPVHDGRGAPSYAWNPDMAPVFQVDEPLVRDITRALTELRYRQIFGFPRAGIDRVRLEQAGGVVECRRDTVYGGWLVEEPKFQMVDASVVEVFIRRIWGLTAKAFVAERLETPALYGLDPPHARVSLWREGELVREVQVGARDRRVYAKADHRPEVVELEPNDAGKLNLELTPVVVNGTVADTVRMGSPDAR